MSVDLSKRVRETLDQTGPLRCPHCYSRLSPEGLTELHCAGREGGDNSCGLVYEKLMDNGLSFTPWLKTSEH